MFEIVPSESLCEIKTGGGVRYERDKGTGKGLREEDSNPPLGRMSEPLCSEIVYFFRTTPSRIYKVC